MLIRTLLTKMTLLHPSPHMVTSRSGHPRAFINIAAEITTKSTPFIACGISHIKHHRNKVFLLWLTTTRQLHRTESLNRLWYHATAAVLRSAIKDTLCRRVLRSTWLIRKTDIGLDPELLPSIMLSQKISLLGQSSSSPHIDFLPDNTIRIVQSIRRGDGRDFRQLSHDEHRSKEIPLTV